MTKQGELKDWIKSETDPGEYNEHLLMNNLVISIQKDWANAFVTFYPDDLVEYRIVNQADGEDKFMLHFRLEDIGHAKHLFNEMMSALEDLKEKQKYRVLLCCTCGMTTSYFAEKLQKAADVLERDYYFKAVSFDRLFQKGFEYDMILLAPQAAFQVKKVQEIITDKPVMAIPGKIFGAYNVNALLEMIDQKRMEQAKKLQRKGNEAAIDASDGYRILVIVMVNAKDNVRYACRLYDNGHVVDEVNYLKPSVAVGDLDDIIDAALIREGNFDAVGISMPGISDRGTLNDLASHVDNLEMSAHIRNKFHLPCVLSNDANAAACGYWQMHQSYQNLLFYFQPRGMMQPGAGVVINGKLYCGRKGFAGEIKYFQSDIKWSGDPEKMIWDTDGAEEIITKMLNILNCTYAPDLIVLYSEMTPDTERIKKGMAACADENYIPEIRRIDNMMEYMFIGQVMLCIDNIKKG